MRRRIVWVVTGLLLVGQGWPVGTAASPEEELADARRRIREVERELGEVAATAEQRAADVAAIEEQVRSLEDALNDTLRTLEAQESAVAEARARAETARAERAEVRRGVAARARRTYMGSLPPELQIVTSSGDLSETLEGIATLDLLAGRDGATMEQLAAAETVAAAAEIQLEAEEQRLVTVRQQREQLLADVMETLERERRSLAAVRARREALLAEREDLEDDSSQLQSIIAARQAPPPQRSSAPAPRSGSGYAWPFCGPVTSEFGPRWGRTHEGMDIDGVTGDVLVAAEDGVVIFAGRSGGYGLLTLIEHPDGVVTSYAHQSRQDVAAGQAVSRGQRIGLMGATGNVTGDHLHFETRVGGRAVNPRRYLSATC